eukprot:13245950-Heterocapsa_arctica.AAC.1
MASRAGGSTIPLSLISVLSKASLASALRSGLSSNHLTISFFWILFMSLFWAPVIVSSSSVSGASDSALSSSTS